MSDLNLVEIDSLEATVIIDNELDPLSPVAPDTVQVSGLMGSLTKPLRDDMDERGPACRELRMDDICCSAHGLSIMVTATKGDFKRSILFDAGPKEEVWEKNVNRLHPDLSSVDLIQLSHWHRDHSGGLLRAIRMINDAKQTRGLPRGVVADVHPSRPDYRGFAAGERIVSLEADPTFEELESTGAIVNKYTEAHTVLDNLFLISGEIPRVTPYEVGLKGAMRFDGQENDWFSDESITDERFLMCNLKDKGIVVFTACSHAGVVNAARHAINLLSGSVPLYAVIGGFHLAASEHEHIENTVKDLKLLDPAVLLPGHCTGWRAKFAIERHMPGTLVPCTVGMKISF